MIRVMYTGGHEAVVVPALGMEFERGKPVEVDDSREEVAEAVAGLAAESWKVRKVQTPPVTGGHA